MPRGRIPKISPKVAARREAQKLAWDAMEARDAGRLDVMIELCGRAIEIHEVCIDAHLMLLEVRPLPQDARIAILMELVARGARDLGRQFLSEHEGAMWDELEGRPLMRAMATLFGELVATGRTEGYDEAIALGEDMLRADTDDHLGMREVLGPVYLARRQWDDARRLLARFDGCSLLPLEWTRLMLVFATEGADAASMLLPGITARNGVVAVRMRGSLRRRRYRAASYLAGSEEEAEMAIDCLRPALRAMPSFRKWLRSAAGNRLSDPGS